MSMDTLPRVRPDAVRRAAALGLALALPWAAAAQSNAPAAATNFAAAAAASALGGNLLAHQVSGEVTEPLGNYWDGVDAGNNLRVRTAVSPVLNDVGKMVDTPMSPTVNVADMNDDGLKDLVVSDTYGFLWIFPNSGEPGKPRFTTGAFMPTFLGWGAKIHVCDWDDDGDFDVLIGTFYGDIAVLENIGTKREPRFARRMGVPRYVDPQFGIDDPKDRLPTLRLGKQTMLLGNYMAPWVVDWNQDGKPDLILGEGTYSANSVRLLINAGARNRAVFTEDRVFYLAYGEGSEQLTPAIVDYNGDGINDLLVGTRTGQVRMHKGTKAAVEGKNLVAAMRGTLAPAVLEFEGVLKIGGKDAYDRMSNVFPCDWNGDDLFDLVLGLSDGRLAVALNQGSKTVPAFPKVEPILGADTEKDLLQPAGWMNGIERVFWSNFFGGFGNTAILFTAEKEYIPRPGAPPIRPVDGQYFFFFRYVHGYPGWTHNRLAWILPINRSDTVQHVIGARVISPRQTVPLKIKQQYELSFSSILEGKPVMWCFWTHELMRRATEEVADQFKTQYASGMVPPSLSWQKRAFRFRCPSEVQTNWNYHFYFRMPEGDVKFLMDDLEVRELGR